VTERAGDDSVLLIQLQSGGKVFGGERNRGGSAHGHDLNHRLARLNAEDSRAVELRFSGAICESGGNNLLFAFGKIRLRESKRRSSNHRCQDQQNGSHSGGWPIHISKFKKKGCDTGGGAAFEREHFTRS
jgi:hypothetical protein